VRFGPDARGHPPLPAGDACQPLNLRLLQRNPLIDAGNAASCPATPFVRRLTWPHHADRPALRSLDIDLPACPQVLVQLSC
jgi:hypothetical protein